jgi:acyl dehydratase
VTAGPGTPAAPPPDAVSPGGDTTPPEGCFATITGVDAVHPAAVRQLFEAAEVTVPAGSDAELARRLGGAAPLSTYLTFALPAWRQPGRPLAEAGLPPLPYHTVTARYGHRAIATSVEVTAAGPMRFGDRITSHWAFRGATARATRLGPGALLDFETRFVTQAADPVAVERTRILVFEPGGDASGEARGRGAAPVPLPATRDDGPPFDPARPQAGQRLPAIRLGMSLQRLVMIAAANRDFAPVHHDFRAAAEIGAPAPIVNSMFLLTLAERMAFEAAGLDAAIARLGPLRMLRPTPAGTTVACYGRVISVAPAPAAAPAPAGRRVTAEILIAVEPGGLTACCEVEFVVPGRG